MAGRLGSVKGQASASKGRKFPAEPLTPAEAAAIIGACSAKSRTGIRNRALLTLLYRSGLRISEILAIKPSSVDMTGHSIRLLDSKSGQAQTRGFHPSADDALARWLDTRRAIGVRNGTLFCKRGPVQAQYVRLMMQRMATRAGVDKRVHPHGFRHTFAVELRSSGTDLGAISKLLGHASIVHTARYLDHLTNGEAIATLQAVDLPPLAET